MRRFGTTLILLVLAVGFGAYLYFVDAKKPIHDEDAKQNVFSFDASKIGRIELKSATGDLTVLKKDATGWSMVTPVQTSADQNNASDLAASLATLEQNRVVEENAADLTPYGLTEPRIDITFTVEGEKEPKRIQFGNKSPTGVGLYARLPADRRVFLVSNTAETSLNQSTFDLRDKTVLRIDTGKIDSIELVSKNQTSKVVRAGRDWKMVKPIEAPADFTSVEALLGQLRSAQMMSLKDSPEDLKDLKPYGLDKPEVTATLGSGSSSVLLQLGSKADTVTVWARDPSRPAVFSVGNSLAEGLRVTPFDLRRKDIFEFRPFNAARFEITRGKETRAFERVKGSTPSVPDTWRQVVPAVKTVDSSNFAGALLEFSNLRADAALDKAGSAAGLSSPAAVITVKFDDGKKEERVTISRAGDQVFAARADQPGALKLNAAEFDAAVKKLDTIQ